MTYRTLLTSSSVIVVAALSLSAPALAVASADARLKVHCVGGDGKATKAIVLTDRGTITPEKQGAATIVGLEPGRDVLIECRAEHNRVSVRHRVASRTQSVYLTLTRRKAAKTERSAKRKKARRGRCTVKVSATPWAKCSVNGNAARTTRFVEQLMGPKVYKVVCSRGGVKKTKSFRCRPGKSKSLLFTMN